MTNPYQAEDSDQPRQLSQVSIGLIAGIISGVIIGLALSITLSTWWGEISIRWSVNGL